MSTDLRMWLAAFAFIAWLGADALAEDRRPASGRPESENAEKSQQRRKRAEDLAVLTKAAGSYTVTLAENDWAATFQREAVFRWTSFAGTRDAALFLWLADERPVAACTILWRPPVGLYHEFQSLAIEPLHAELADKKVWDVPEPGVKMTPIPSAPEPEATAAKRLTQMKSMAARFRAEAVKGLPNYADESVWELRLLPNPLVRYGGPKHAERDGAFFIFCHDTDPGVFLMIELRGDAEEAQWHYAMGPMTGWPAKAWYDDTLVWSQIRLHPANDPRLLYFVIGPTPVK